MDILALIQKYAPCSATLPAIEQNKVNVDLPWSLGVYNPGNSWSQPNSHLFVCKTLQSLSSMKADSCIRKYT